MPHEIYNVVPKSQEGGPSCSSIMLLSTSIGMSDEIETFLSLVLIDIQWPSTFLKNLVSQYVSTI